VFTLRVDPGNANKFLIATYGRSDWTYTFTKPTKSTPGGRHHHHHHHHRLHCPAGEHKVTRRSHGKTRTVCARRKISRRPKHPRGFTGRSGG
jgi:hypothetical protein